MRKISELPGLQDLKVFAITDESAAKTMPSLTYDGIIPKVLVPESLKEHLERIAFTDLWGTQGSRHAADLQEELKPVA